MLRVVGEALSRNHLFKNVRVTKVLSEASPFKCFLCLIHPFRKKRCKTEAAFMLHMPIVYKDYVERRPRAV